MRALRPDQLELIDALVAQTPFGGITAGLLEKDEHLTDALRAMFAMLQGEIQNLNPSISFRR